MDIGKLTRRMSQGDETAWRSFYDGYFDRLWRYLLVCAEGNEDLARESLQAAMVRVARHIKVFEREEVFWSWLTVVARSAFADERKKRRRYFSFLERFKGQSEIDTGSDPADERLNTLLSHQLATLPPEESRLIQQKYFERKTVREMAEELGVTEKAVESQLSRIRRKLKAATLKELNDEAQQ